MVGPWQVERGAVTEEETNNTTWKAPQYHKDLAYTSSHCDSSSPPRLFYSWVPIIGASCPTNLHRLTLTVIKPEKRALHVAPVERMVEAEHGVMSL